ncbi:hypothetical protein O181_027880 [Austropuccinia psidii MF-1]|uniref:Uncharacterized protein n=1 Tax=Austropuccinia psidii MF-1 TaxID=1389203 RepID=A0A9Q3CS76_9BASI|nr:hypothetical protein [Austropuccinia psidii MF-1]
MNYLAKYSTEEILSQFLPYQRTPTQSTLLLILHHGNMVKPSTHNISASRISYLISSNAVNNSQCSTETISSLIPTQPTTHLSNNQRDNYDLQDNDNGHGSDTSIVNVTKDSAPDKSSRLSIYNYFKLKAENSTWDHKRQQMQFIYHCNHCNAQINIARHNSSNLNKHRDPYAIKSSLVRNAEKYQKKLVLVLIEKNLRFGTFDDSILCDTLSGISPIFKWPQ